MSILENDNLSLGVGSERLASGADLWTMVEGYECVMLSNTLGWPRSFHLLEQQQKGQKSQLGGLMRAAMNPYT